MDGLPQLVGTARIAQVKRELDHWVLDRFEETLREIGVPNEERSELGRNYLEVARLGFA